MVRTQYYTSGLDGNRLENVLEKGIKHSKADLLHIACAYTSVYGARFIEKVVKHTSVTKVHLITDVRDHITHPTALALGLELGWHLRVVDRSSSIFHPKLFIASRNGLQDAPHQPRFVVLGSGNLSKGGLVKNVEAGIVQRSDRVIPDVADLYNQLWNIGEKFSANKLKRYEAAFRMRNSQRKTADLFALGVADNPEPTEKSPKKIKLKGEPALPTQSAQAIWVGLETITGEYTLQVEIPKAVSVVLRRLIGNAGQDSRVGMLCDDGEVREITCRYYDHNGMYRVNIPNDVPGAANARLALRGLAMVEKVSGNTDQLHLTIVDDAEPIAAMIDRSYALGTLGKTSTRFYGWF